MNIIYLDNSATTRVYPEVAAAMTAAMEADYGNPSSLHTMGFSAEKTVTAAREKIARRLGASAKEIVFTSGGTESNNLALIGAYGAMRIKGGIITTYAEHKSVLEPIKALGGARYLAVDKNGRIDLGELREAVDENTSIVSIMHVNNETGAIAPLEEIAAVIKRKNPKTLLHVDAVQSFCKLSIPKNTADLISISAHKIHGPKGAGALYIRKGVRVKPLILGGGQEGGMRSGTENTPGIAGFGVAAEMPYDAAHITRLNRVLRERLHGVTVNSPDSGAAHILNIAAVGVRSEILLHSLEREGVIVSSGSACSSNSSRASSSSHVLTAMGLPPDVIDSSVRLSLSPLNTLDEINRAAEIINKTAEQLRAVISKKSAR